jgi:outer membrane receptor protein involved in Fe transport
MNTLRAMFMASMAFTGLAWAGPQDDARRHFNAGLEAANEGRYHQAIKHFKEAQDALPHPSTIFNIARAYTDMGDLDNALLWYTMYRDVADAADAQQVEPMIRLIEAQLNRKPQTSPDETEPVVEGENAVVEAGDLARLQALSTELSELVESLEGWSPESQASETAETETSEVEALLPEGEFIEQPYERVVVTASRYGQHPLDTPSATTILTADDIRALGATNIPDLLRSVVGVDVMSLGAGQADLSIRGFNRELSNKVLVLIDGRSTYLDFLGNTIWATLPVSLEEIERIEVIRGPGSAVYGANAMTGVINIITRAPSTQGGSTISVDGGRPGYARTTLLTSGSGEYVKYRFSAGIEEHGRWEREQDPSEDSALEPFIENQSLATNILRAHGHLDRTFGTRGFASISGGYSSGQMEFYNIGALGAFGMDFEAQYLRGDLGYGPFHLRTFFNTIEGQTGPWLQAADTTRSLNSPMANDTLDIELEAPGEAMTGSVSHRYNAGIGYRYKLVRMGYIQGGYEQAWTEHHFNAFAHDEAALGPLRLIGSLRLDRHPLIDDLSKTISPRGAVVVRVAEKRSIRASAGTAFRAPTSLESYMDFDLPTGVDGAFVTDLGSISLNPESIFTAEIGIHDESTPYHSADLALYRNHVTELITLQDELTHTIGAFDSESGGYQAGVTGWINSDLVYTGYGAELDLEIYPVTGLEVFANLNLMTVLEENPEGEVLQDESASRVKLNGGIVYRSPWRTDLSLIGNYSSAQEWRLREFDESGDLVVVPAEVDPRTILGARLATRPLVDEVLELSVTGWNLLALSNPVQEHPKGQRVGPRIFGSIRLDF